MKNDIIDNSNIYSLFKLNEYGKYDYCVSFYTINDFFEYMIMNGLYVSNGYIYKVEKTDMVNEFNITYVKYIYHTYILTRNHYMVDPEAIYKSIKGTSCHFSNKLSRELFRSADYQFRHDPVPGTHCSYGAYLRYVKNWFHNYRLVNIPEYRQYTRIRTAPDDPYDVERPKPSYRSWKHNTKKKHQWE